MFYCWKVETLSKHALHTTYGCVRQRLKMNMLKFILMEYPWALVKWQKHLDRINDENWFCCPSLDTIATIQNICSNGSTIYIYKNNWSILIQMEIIFIHFVFGQFLLQNALLSPNRNGGHVCGICSNLSTWISFECRAHPST